MNAYSTMWRLSPLAFTAVAAATVGEAASNGLRAYGLGSALEQFTTTVRDHQVSVAGAILVLASIGISLAGGQATWSAFRSGGGFWRRLLAALVGIFCLSVSIWCMKTHQEAAFAVKVTAAAAEGNSYERAQAAYDKARAELDAMGTGRSTAEVRAAMENAPVSRRTFADTAECTSASMTASDRKACKPILVLREEMATAIRRQDLQDRLDEANASLATLKPTAPSASAGTTVGLEEQRLLALAFGVAVVLVATLGPAVLAHALPAPVLPTPSPAPPALVAVPVEDEEDEDVPALPAGGSRVFSKQEALADLLTMTALGQTVDSQDALAARYGVRKGTISKWLTEWEEAGLIARAPNGRCKAIEAA